MEQKTGTYMRSSKTVIIIPARYGSTRLHGKPLIKVMEKPLIQWVYENASKSELADDIIVATDNQEIFDTVKAFGGKVEMTSGDHNSGSDRITEVAKRNEDFGIIVNVQGDEPLINAEGIDKAINALNNDSIADISTLIRIISDRNDILNPNLVKVVKDNQDYALYFSRSPIPYERNEADYYAHIGLYAYRRESLLRMANLAQTSLEKAESLEQLRALQNGMKIKTLLVNFKPIGIDTKKTLKHFKNKCS